MTKRRPLQTGDPTVDTARYVKALEARIERLERLVASALDSANAP